jgi:hypothetical protein
MDDILHGPKSDCLDHSLRPAPGRVRAWALAALLCAGLGAPRELGAAPVWPLDLPHRYLTSNFMERRPGRLHAGLDLRTEGRTGFPVRAAEDGYVSRLRASAGGYGRALYLRGRSGLTYVYAHLERLADRPRDRLRRVQRDRGRYAIDIYLEPEEIAVRRGEVIGLSGQSGTLGPHLHFEVRDGAQRPQDPLRHFAVDDTLAPVIVRLRAVPWSDPAARIAGRSEPHVLVGGDGLAGELPPLEIRGPVAFAAEIVDRADVLGYRLEPQRIEVTLDGEPVFMSANETFSFAEQAQVQLEWLPEEDLHERWLHRRSEDLLEGRSGRAWPFGSAGKGLEPGPHRLRLRAADRAGNAVEVSWRLDVAPLLDATESAAAGRSGATATADAPVLFPFSSADAGEAPGELAWTPEMVGLRVPLAEDAAAYLAPGGRWFLEAAVPVEAAVPGAAIAPVDPGLVAAWLAAGELLAPVTLYRIDAAAEPVAALERAWSDQRLLPTGISGDFAAWEWPAERAPWVTLGSPPECPDDLLSGGWVEAAPGVELGAYRFDGERWSFVATPRLFRRGAQADGNEVQEARCVPLTAPGRFALFRDVEPPIIDDPGSRRVARNAESSPAPEVTPPRWEVIAVAVSDRGSGIDPGAVRVWLDGEPLVVEPDLVRDRVLVELPDATEAGRHRLGIEIGDRAGNFSARSLVLDCGP